MLFDFGFVHLYLIHFLCFKHGLEYDSLHMLMCVSISVGESLVVHRMYRSSYVLGSDLWEDIGYFSYHRSGVHWDS